MIESLCLCSDAWFGNDGDGVRLPTRFSVADGGWQEARLVGQSTTHGWQRWEHLAPAGNPGDVAIRARATDLAGHTQPARPRWNRRGYGGNFIHEVTVRLRPDATVR